MAKLLTFIGIMLLVAACAVTGGTGGSAYTETGAICDVAGLNSRLSYLKDESDSTRVGIAVGTPKGGGAGAFARTDTDIEKEWQPVVVRLNRFDLELEAQHRNVVASCKNHARCMEMRNFREGQCIASMNRWDQAEEEFSDLSTEILRIKADVEKTRLIVRRGRRGGRDVNRYGGRDRDCSSSTGPFC